MINNGGPAFARQGFEAPNGEIYWPQDGMTLRQWYAGRALTGLTASPNCTGIINEDAKDAWDYADAMIAFEKNEETNDGF